MKNLFHVLSIITLLFFTSCDKNESEDVLQNSTIIDDINLKTYQFHKDIIIKSNRGSEGTMRVYSNSQETLDGYSSTNFTLLEIQSGETLQKSLTRHGITIDDDDTSSEANDDSDLNKTNSDESQATGFKLINIKNKKSSTKYAVYFDHPKNNNSKASFTTKFHYSAEQQNLEVTAVITKIRNKRVFYGLKYKINANSSWSTIVNDFVKLKKRNPGIHTKNPVYQFRFHVRSKHHNAYITTFDY